MDLNDCLQCMTHSSKYTSSAIIHVDFKPSITFQAKDWLPKKVKVLFLGEAPPYHQIRKNQVNDSYFYNPHETNRFFGPPSPLLGTLSWNIFDLLGFKRTLSKSEKLIEFMKKGFYYLEAVKCRIERFENKSLVNHTVKNCSQFLDDELLTLQPETIVVMGERALFGLKCCNQLMNIFPNENLNQLMKQTILNPIKINTTNYYFIPIPIWRNRKYLIEIQSIFGQISKEE